MANDRDFTGQQPPPKQRHVVVPVFCPRTETRKSAYLTAGLVDKILRYGPRSRYHAIVGDRSDPTTGSPVQQVLLNPVVVFEGVREHQHGGICYSGIPTCRYTDEGAPIPGFVFLVYINPMDWLYEWRWDKEDPNMPGYPLGWDDPARFKAKLWPK
ncbi:MAG TPA: hypothetical protein VFE47_13330 [Tepidisphaeraceae bacterium]|nr:hypothetical protein [Tepidisphaeraceae bacterium]